MANISRVSTDPGHYVYRQSQAQYPYSHGDISSPGWTTTVAPQAQHSPVLTSEAYYSHSHKEEPSDFESEDDEEGYAEYSPAPIKA